MGLLPNSTVLILCEPIELLCFYLYIYLILTSLENLRYQKGGNQIEKVVTITTLKI